MSRLHRQTVQATPGPRHSVPRSAKSSSVARRCRFLSASRCPALSGSPASAGAAQCVCCKGGGTKRGDRGRDPDGADASPDFGLPGGEGAGAHSRPT
jgi:hypothetical protein